MLAGRAERTWDAALPLFDRVGDNPIISSLQNGEAVQNKIDFSQKQSVKSVLPQSDFVTQNLGVSGASANGVSVNATCLKRMICLTA